MSVLAIQQRLLQEWQDIAKKEELPHDAIMVGRGMVYEELAELTIGAQRHHFAKLAYQDLSQNAWFVKLEPQRLERLKQSMITCAH